MTRRHDSIALALGGGGARAAYQAGVLRALARRFPGLSFPILTGVSAGAINAALLANHSGTFLESAEELAGLWSGLRLSDVFSTSPASLVSRVARTALQLVVGTPPGREPVHGMVDTSPLRRYLHRKLGTHDGLLRGVAANVASGRIEAVALSATLYSTGQTVTFCAGRRIETWDRPKRVARRVDLTVDHVLASSALPLLFPAVRVGDEWFGDGGVRLVAPLAPALHLGADRIVAVSTSHLRSRAEAGDPTFVGPPAPAQVMGVLYNAVFLDLLEQDAYHLERLNELVAELPPDKRHGLRTVELLVIRPSLDLGVLADDYELELPSTFRYLTRRLGTRRARSQDLLSTILFEPAYLRRLLELGEQDGAAHASEVGRFLESRPVRADAAPRY